MPTIVEQTRLESTKPTAPAEDTSLRRRLSPKALYIGGGAVVLVALIAWGVTVSGQRKAEYSARALDEARAVAESGNLPLASSSLQKVIQSYAGTPAAEEAVITLNQVRLVNGQNELAAVNLREYLNGKHDPQYVAAANGLLGTALENAKRPLEAAAAYKAASEASPVDYLKADYLLDAARADRDGGKLAEAEAAYREVLAKYPKTASVTEAQVRLAELTAGKK
jgi:outer membrane protein assembly factor BamD (BamD/ComL family)